VVCLSTTTVTCAKDRTGLVGNAANISKMTARNLTLSVGGDVITPVRDLGVYLDAGLTMKHHVNRVTSSCFFQLRRLRQISRVAGPDITKEASVRSRSQ